MSKLFTILIFKDLLFRILFFLSLALNLSLWLLIYFKFSSFRTMGEILPLHYNIYFGVDFVGEWYKIFIMPFAGIFFVIVNFVLADIVYLRDKITSYFLTGAGTFIQVLLLLAAYAVIMINE